MNNDQTLFIFGLIFLVIGSLAPLINNSFNTQFSEYDTDIPADELGQESITGSDAVQVLSGIFFWVFGAPAWLNLLLTMMRILFWVMVWNKIRGIGS